jgi:FkbM family methyltransferase
MRALGGALPADGIAIDIGANLGAIALAMSALAPKGQVFAFEPVPETFAFLQRNLEANRVTNVLPVNAGVFSSPGSLEFHYVEEFAGGAFLSPTGVSDRREKRTSVECVMLDSFVADHGLTRVDVIKIDVEGAEDDVLAGASKTCRDLVPTLVIEFNPKTSELFFGRTLEGLYRRLVEWSYSLSLIERPTGSLWKVTDYATLIERIARDGGVGDVLCVPGRHP